jgi:hypothetical protein
MAESETPELVPKVVRFQRVLKDQLAEAARNAHLSESAYVRVAVAEKIERDRKAAA